MENLSLIAGLIASDGHLDKDYNGIRFITGNIEMLKKFTELTKDYNKKIWSSISGFKSKRYIVYIYDKDLKAMLEKKYKIPRGKKSDKIIVPEDIPAKEKLKFIKGLFSGDGSISFDRKANKKYMQIIFWTKSKELANDIKKIFNKYKISCGINYSEQKDQYRVTIRENNSLKIFKKLIGFFHPQKQRILETLT